MMQREYLYWCGNHCVTLQVDVSYNKIEVLQPRTFVGLPSLSSINLTGNTISTVSEFSFVDLPNMLKIDLSRQNISLLQTFWAQNMTGLTTVRMSVFAARSQPSVMVVFHGSHFYIIINNSFEWRAQVIHDII